MGARDIVAEQPAVVGRWSEGLDELHRRVAHRFSRSEARERAKRSLLGLLGRIERKNGRQLWRDHRREGPTGGAAPAELGQVGSRPGPRRPERVRRQPCFSDVG